MTRLRIGLAGFAFCLGAAGLCGARDPAGPVPARTAADVTAEIEALDKDYQALVAEEQEWVTGLKAAAPGLTTNRTEAAGHDPDLADKLNKLKELERQVRALKEEVRLQIAANPAWKERQERMAGARHRLMELQKAKQERSARREVLLQERRLLEAAPSKTEEDELREGKN